MGSQSVPVLLLGAFCMGGYAGKPIAFLLFQRQYSKAVGQEEKLTALPMHGSRFAFCELQMEFPSRSNQRTVLQRLPLG